MIVEVPLARPARISLAPCWMASVLQAQLDMRGVEEGESVKFSAATYGLSISILDCNLLVEALTVVEFSRKKFELEEFFMSIVEGGQDGR